MSYKPFKMKGHSLPGINQRKADKTADGRPGSSALQMKTDAELKAADQAKQDKSQRQQNGKGMTDGERSAADKKSAMKKLDRSKAKRNDPDDGVVSASEASGGMFMKKSPVKRAGYYEYDADGNKQRITTKQFNEKKKKGGASATAGVASEKGKAGTVVADQSHGNKEIKKSEKSTGPINSPERDKAVKVGKTPRGQRGTYKKTTRYEADKKNQDEFDKKKESGDKSMAKMYGSKKKKK